MKRSEHTKRLISLHNGMHRQETREKLKSFRTGKHWYNNGEISVCAEQCPDGFVKGLLRKRKDGETQND